MMDLGAVSRSKPPNSPDHVARAAGRLSDVAGGPASGTHHALVNFDHMVEMTPRFLEEPFRRPHLLRRPAWHASREQAQLAGVHRKRVRLEIVGELQAMSGAAEIHTRRPVARIPLRKETLCPDGARVRIACRRGAPRAAAVQTLQALHHELDVANAAVLKLYVDRLRAFLGRELLVEPSSRVADNASIAKNRASSNRCGGSTKSRRARPTARSPAATRALISICSSQSRARPS